MKDSFNLRFYLIGILIMSLANAKGQTDPITDRIDSSSVHRGAMEFRIGAMGMNFFSRNIVGASIGTVWRSPGVRNDGRGRFSIGLQAGYWPHVIRVEELPYSILHVNRFRLETSSREPAMLLNDQEFQQGALLLMGNAPISFGLRGSLSASPGGADVLELHEYRMTNIRMDMAGLNIPLRWYLNSDRKDGPRPRYFVEAGFGMDKLFVSADYEVIERGVEFDLQNSMIEFTLDTSHTDQPFEGTISRNLIFANVNFSAGVEFGHFVVFVQRRGMFSRKLQHRSEEHSRIRGNPLAVPILADAGSDGSTMNALASDGILYYGSTDIDPDEGNGAAKSSDRATGLQHYWDPGQWCFGISFRLF